MLKIAVCDDERTFIEQEYECINTIMSKEYPDVKYEIIKYLTGDALIDNCNNIDIIFLDIELGNEDGFEIAKKIILMQEDAKIVFVTSYENLVFESFVFRPVGFIRKRLFDKEIEMIINQMISGLIKENKIIVVGEGKNTYTILLSRIRSIDTLGHYITIKMSDKEITVRDKLSRIEAGLLKNDFVKINRGSIVNLQFVTEVNNGDIYMQDGSIFKVSRSNMKNCKIRYRQYVGMK